MKLVARELLDAHVRVVVKFLVSGTVPSAEAEIIKGMSISTIQNDVSNF